MGKLQIDILGTSFTIQSNETDAYLQKLLSYYRQMADGIEKHGGLENPLQISILSGILICDELYKEKLKSAKRHTDEDKETVEDRELDRLTADMISKIDKVLS